MTVQVKKVSINYKGILLDPLWVILDEKSSPPIMPLLYMTYLSVNGCVYEVIELEERSTFNSRTKIFKERSVSDATIRSYAYGLAKFLNYLEVCKNKYNTPSLHSSSSCSASFINHYINTVLAVSLDSSLSLENHRSSLQSYYNWLAYMGYSNCLKLKIDRKTRQNISEKSSKQHYIQYVSRGDRWRLINSCETLAEKLMMRMGYEVGLRTSELVGLRIGGKSSLLDLFEKAISDEFNHVERFSYWLDGKYTKGSKSRWIYFDRSLVMDMKRYFDTERAWLIDEVGKENDSYFLRTDNKYIGTGIGFEQASRVFRKRSIQAGISQLLQFHDLRHTFATELFHAEVAGPNGRETRSESAALIVVGQRLGHAIGKDGQASSVTRGYIRMRLQMLDIESGQ